MTLRFAYSTLRRRFATSASTGSETLNVFKSESNDAVLNLAVEEWLFRDAPIGRQTLFLWRNDKVVIVGRNQNVWKECHVDAIEKNDVQLVRRSSGGGTVYQVFLSCARRAVCVFWPLIAGVLTM